MAANSQKYILYAALLAMSCSVALACHGTLIASGITEGEKRIIMAEHNRLRQLVATGRYPGQPGAENMREIVWDDELAARAQQWANNCQFRHDPQRTINRFTMGQNLAIIWSTAVLDPEDGDFPSRIQSWFNEVQKYSFGDAWSPKTGHYSQLVWGETSLIGCGFSEYQDSSKYNKLYVCNYGPGGNVVGYNPYETGKPSCSTYGMRPSPRYAGLCAAPHTPLNGLTSNTIEKYEYKQSNHLIYKQSAYPATSSSPQQASLLSLSGRAPAPNSAGHQAYSTIRPSYTSAASQYVYKNKFEAYRPSQAEFKKSVYKHTLLRTSLNQEQNNNYPAQGQPQSAQPEEQAQVASSAPPAKRGWSLLTWSG